VRRLTFGRAVKLTIKVTVGLGMAAAIASGLVACGGSGDKTTTTSSSAPAETTSTTDSTAVTATTAGTGTTAAGSATTHAGTGSTAASTPGTPAPTALRPAPSVVVTLYAQKGEVPPGRTEPLEAPAWKATGGGWDPGPVGLVVKRTDGPSVVLDIGAQADAGGRFEQTFVLLEVRPGTYAATATQGDKRAEGSFVLT
jgi:hypothetical protein